MTTSAEIRDKVRCSACQGKISRINLVQLDRLATWEYPVCGNVVTGEQGRAVAILCGPCADGRREVKEAVEFREGEVVYHPIETLTELPPMKDPDEPGGFPCR